MGPGACGGMGGLILAKHKKIVLLLCLLPSIQVRQMESSATQHCIWTGHPSLLEIRPLGSGLSRETSGVSTLVFPDQNNE